MVGNDIYFYTHLFKSEHNYVTNILIGQSIIHWVLIWRLTVAKLNTWLYQDKHEYRYVLVTVISKKDHHSNTLTRLIQNITLSHHYLLSESLRLWQWVGLNFHRNLITWNTFCYGSLTWLSPKLLCHLWLS